MPRKAASAAHVYCSGVFEDMLSRSQPGLRTAVRGVHKLAAGLENTYSATEHLSPSSSVSPTVLLLGDILF